MKPHTSLFLALLLSPPALADGEILGVRTIDNDVGGLGAVLDQADFFGASVTLLGDLDGDGVADIAVGATGDDDAGLTVGALYILLLNGDGTVKSSNKILGPASDLGFGAEVDFLGDVDGDGTGDIAAGADGVYLYFLNPDGTVKSQVHHPATTVPAAVGYGTGVCGPGDIDQDGTPDLIAGSLANAGVPPSIYVHFLSSDGSIRDTQEIGVGAGGFPGTYSDGDFFGLRMSGLGDLDDDGVRDIAVAAPLHDTALQDSGAVWILFLHADGTVKSATRIDADTPELAGELVAGNKIGYALDGRMDLDGNGKKDLVVGTLIGELYVFFLRHDGSIRTWLMYWWQDLGTSTPVALGQGACVLPDLNGDGDPELVAGAPHHPSGGVEGGGVRILLWDAPTLGFSEPFGCGLNPAGSLQVVGSPTMGSTFSFLVDNPLNTQNPGAVPILAISLNSAVIAPPCGFLVPGFHMSPDQAAGELLVFAPYALPEIVGPAWAPGQPSEIPISIPHDPVLLGVSVLAQAALVDVTGGTTGGNFVGLTRGRKLTIGT